jgi:hypothetical protein
MIKQRLISTRENGFVLMFVLVICMISITIGGGLLYLAFNSRMMGVRSGTDIAARTAGDAAVADAVFKMNEKLSRGMTRHFLLWPTQHYPVPTRRTIMPFPKWAAFTPLQHQAGHPEALAW